MQRELSRRYLANERENALALAVANTIERRAGKVRIAELSQNAGVGRRALLQRFDASVGLTPKQYVRITRLRSMITALFARDSEDLSRLSVKYGFYDQSHMIHEFRDLLGIPPAVFKKELDAFMPFRAPAFGRRALPKREQELYRSLGLVSEWEEMRRVFRPTLEVEPQRRGARQLSIEPGGVRHVVRHRSGASQTAASDQLVGRRRANPRALTAQRRGASAGDGLGSARIVQTLVIETSTGRSAHADLVRIADHPVRAARGV